ncbi:MFS transporter [Sporomusa sp.]|uniref:MFS transporter n=1 Tax=Sporomusa sp. TaxID=2078658 RepID=UPI002C8E7D61|nr:MFS transporter [Sporomusa sp.]HWR45502.1 MFS transporter [Sporomusa sp.]
MYDKRFSGWKMLFPIGLVYLFMMGFPQYGGPVNSPFLLKEIPMSRAIFGLGFTLMNLFIGVSAAVIAAPLIGRLGIRGTALFGCSVIILVGILYQVITEPWHYLLVQGVLLPIGICSATMVPYGTWVARWFKRFRGRANGYMMAIASFGGFVAAPILGIVLQNSGGNWRLSWAVIGLVAALGFIANWFLIKESPEAVGQIPDGVTDDADGQTGPKLYSDYEWTQKEAFKTPAFWIIFIGALGFNFPFFFFIAHNVMHLKGLGLPPQFGPWSMAMFTLGGVVGRLISGYLTDRFPARYCLALGIIPTIIGALLNMHVSTPAVALIAAALFGAGFGWPYIAMMTTFANFFGPKPYPQIYGAHMLLAAIVCSPAGLIGGIIFDMNKNYDMAFQIILGICVVSVIALSFVQMPKAPTEKVKQQAATFQ